MHKQCHIINFRSLHKNFQEDHLNSRRFSGFPGVVDTLFIYYDPVRRRRSCVLVRVPSLLIDDQYMWMPLLRALDKPCVIPWSNRPPSNNGTRTVGDPTASLCSSLRHADVTERARWPRNLACQSLSEHVSQPGTQQVGRLWRGRHAAEWQGMPGTPAENNYFGGATHGLLYGPLNRSVVRNHGHSAGATKPHKYQLATHISRSSSTFRWQINATQQRIAVQKIIAGVNDKSNWYISTRTWLPKLQRWVGTHLRPFILFQKLQKKQVGHAHQTSPDAPLQGSATRQM